jgi:hypothetical protein
MPGGRTAEDQPCVTPSSCVSSRVPFDRKSISRRPSNPPRTSCYDGLPGVPGSASPPRVQQTDLSPHAVACYCSLRFRNGLSQGSRRMRYRQRMKRGKKWDVSRVVLLSCAVSTGCQANNPLGSWWNGASTRVPPPATSSYGTPAPYYGPTQPAPGMAPTLPPVTTQPPTTPPPPAVPATGARPSLTTGASAPTFNTTSSPSAIGSWPASNMTPGAVSPGGLASGSSPSVPPTYLSTPARVDTLIRPASAEQPSLGSTSPLPQANGLRWGVR